MEALTLSQVVQACDGRLRPGADPHAHAQRVCTDSRQIQAGDIFFALDGERFDGHSFVAEASQVGAVAVVVRCGKDVPASLSCSVVEVDDPRRALGLLATAYRARFSLPVVAVAGSNGKTSTKELIASVIGQAHEVLASEASFNNDIGVPLTLLRLEQQHGVAVLEVGTNHPGELAPLLRMIQPAYGVLTCIGREHLEFFRNLEGVAQEEGWLAELLPSNGQLIVNGDDAWSSRVAKRTAAKVVQVGEGEQNDWRLQNVKMDKEGIEFRAEGPSAALSGDYRIQLIGRHQALNALFAIHLGAEMGLSKGQIERGLADCRPAKMRLQTWDLNGVGVVDDAYNANADSVVAALKTLVALPCKGRRVAVLGDMAELGAHSEAAHLEVGQRAAELGVDQVFAVGTMASQIARGARAAGLNRVLEFAEIEGAAAAVKSFIRPGDLLLLKASRASRLERVTGLLRNGGSGKTN